MCYNESDSTYDLDVRDHAQVNRVRATIGGRLPSDPSPDYPAGGASSSAGGATETTAAPARMSVEELGALAPGALARRDTKRLDEKQMAALTGGGSFADGTRCMVAEGDNSFWPGVIIGPLKDGTYRVQRQDAQQKAAWADQVQTVKMEQLRAPGEAANQWPAGTKVSVYFNHTNKWQRTEASVPISDKPEPG